MCYVATVRLQKPLRDHLAINFSVNLVLVLVIFSTERSLPSAKALNGGSRGGVGFLLLKDDPLHHWEGGATALRPLSVRPSIDDALY